MGYLILTSLTSISLLIVVSYLNYRSWLGFMESSYLSNFEDVRFFFYAILVTSFVMVILPILYIIHYFAYFWLLLGILVCASAYLIVRGDYNG